jgi:hypothetical protein
MLTSDVGLDKIVTRDPRIITGDYDGDGAADLLIAESRAGGMLHAMSGNKNHWLRFALKAERQSQRHWNQGKVFRRQSPSLKSPLIGYLGQTQL